jgi:hypothetical protein
MANSNEKQTAPKLTRQEKRVQKAARSGRGTHFNLLDGFILLLVLLCVCGCYFRYTAYDNLLHRVNKEDYVLSFEVQNIRYTTPNYINVGDEVRMADDGEVLGTLIAGEDSYASALKITPATAYFTDTSGGIVAVSYPDDESRVDVSGRILCSGTMDNEGFCLDGTRYLAPGSTVAAHTDWVSFTLTVTGVEKSVE